MEDFNITKALLVAVITGIVTLLIFGSWSRLKNWVAFNHAKLDLTKQIKLFRDFDALDLPSNNLSRDPKYDTRTRIILEGFFNDEADQLYLQAKQINATERADTLKRILEEVKIYKK